MNAGELAAALTERGLNATAETAPDGVEKVRIRGPEDGGTSEIAVENGIPFWPWGSPIRPATDDESENDPHAIATRLDHFIRARVRFRTSGA